MAGHPGAAQAVEHLVARSARLLTQADGQPQRLYSAFGSISSKGQPRFHQTGDIALADVKNMVLQGNLRERMNALGNAQRELFDLLEQLAQEVELSPRVASLIERVYGLDTKELVRLLLNMEQRQAPHLFAPSDGGQVALQSSMRALRQGPSPAATRAIAAAHRLSTARLTPPLSSREKSHAREGARRALAVSSSAARSLDGVQSIDDAPFRLPHVDGATGMRAVSSHPWHQQSREAGMATRVSISGTAYRLSALQRLMDPHPERSRDFTMALIGHLVPHHHSYHEVMAAVAEVGDTYDPTPRGMLAHARRVLAEHPPTRDKHQLDNLEALRRTADEVDRSLSQQEEG